jgi:hypothetical protein
VCTICVRVCTVQYVLLKVTLYSLCVFGCVTVIGESCVSCLFWCQTVIGALPGHYPASPGHYTLPPNTPTPAAVSAVSDEHGLVSITANRVPEWRSGLRHCISVQEVSLQSLGQIQAVSHPAVIGSPIEWCTIGPASSRFGRGRLSL